jgi:hypothetical protein
MAGTRHHEIPRFLQKGFASRIVKKGKKESVFVWVYRKGNEPYECNTVNVGVETKFYTDGSLNVDDEITELEKPFSKCVANLRDYDDSTRVTDDTFLEFVVNLTVRTKHIRDSIIDSTSSLIDNLFGYFSDYENWREYCVEYFARHPEIIRDELEKTLQGSNLSAHKRAMARQKIKRMPAERIVQFLDKDASNYELLFQSLRIQALEGLKDIAKQAHIRSLLKNLVSEPRVESYKKLRWFIRRTTDPLILGDVCCLFKLDSGFKSLGGTEDTIDKIYLPIASDCVVVATASDEIPKVDVAAVNEMSARVSREFFIASLRSGQIECLSSVLGTDSDILSKSEMETLITDVIEES